MMILGKAYFLTRRKSLATQAAPSARDWAKKIQGKKQVNSSMEKFWIREPMMYLNTMVRITICISGLRKDQKNPRAEFLYLTFRSRLTN